MRQRIETSRAGTRTSVRIIVGATGVLVGGMLVFSRDYLVAYDTVTGQLVLLGIGSVFAVGLVALGKFAAVDQPARFLALEGGRMP